MITTATMAGDFKTVSQKCAIVYKKLDCRSQFRLWYIRQILSRIILNNSLDTPPWIGVSPEFPIVHTNQPTGSWVLVLLAHDIRHLPRP